MNKFDLTIIVTVFNLEDYIEECLKSIIKQADAMVEVIIINDGSRDRSGDICNTFANGENIVVIHQNNIGVSGARNIGLEKARGDYVTFIDGDDVLADGAISNIRLKVSRSNIDIIAGRFQKFHNTTTDSALNSIDKDIIDSIESKVGHEAFKELLRHSVFLPSMCTTVCSRKLFVDNDIYFDTRLINNEDIDCAINLYMVAKTFAVLDKPHYFYRQSRETSATKQYTARRIRSSSLFLTTWHNRMSILEENNVIKPWLMDYLLYQYSIMLGSIYLCVKSERKQLLSEALTLESLFSFAKKTTTKNLSILYKLLGIKLTARLLAWVIRYKSR